MSSPPLTRTARNLYAHGLLLTVVAAVTAAGAFFWADGILGLTALAGAGALAATAALVRGIVRARDGAERRFRAQIARFVEADAAPSFSTDAEGRIDSLNRAARNRFGACDEATLAHTLGELFANPRAILARLQYRAEARGFASEDLVTRRGHLRLAVHRMGEGGFLWRLEDMAERGAGGRGAEGLSLPMFTVSRSGTILFMNEVARRLVGERARTLDRVFRDLPLRSGEVHDIAAADGVVRALVVVIEGNGGRSEVYLMPAPEALAEQGPDSAAFEMLPVALLRLNEAGELSAANRAARRLIGKVTPGDNVAALFEGLGRPVADWLRDTIAGRAGARPEVLRVRGDDQDLFLQVTLSKVVDEGRTEIIAVLSDATQLKTLEAQFVQSQKMQAIGQLAGGVAHDFNNLLTAISGHCDLLLLRHDKGAPDYADLVQISQNANRAASLVNQLLAFSRKQTLKPEIIDPREALSDLTHLLNRLVGEKVRLALSHGQDLGHIRADRRQLEQVMMNLVVNARDAMPEGGEIRIETEALLLKEDFRRDRVSIPTGNYVTVRVSDEGVGIVPDKIQKIFEPFYTTKRQGEGTGLGLSTVYGIVKQTGGYVFCDSVVGQGTTFTLYFPAHDAVAEPQTEPAPQMRALRLEAESGVVLLVEDEAPVRAFASRALKLSGHTVIEAGSAEEALKLLEDEALSVDVFVTDVIMPGIDGPSWVREALKTRPGTRVVFVSGYAEESLTETRERIPNSVFLPKPFSLTELTATVQGQIH
ncbi:MAG: response regulator [Defluviimonas sp.]|uniref:ATP-binding protein n=1 Tax=Albidovulum sp. TaxID=1872424 RepID=UPI001DBF5A00|nr:response regulator [Paracoccaceae bacterium]MCC0063980.1 response regulator [Defluviimonas sp.]